MKKCPQCGTAYTDETLRFCLADGALLSADGEEATVVARRAVVEPEASGKGAGLKIAAAVAALGLLVVALLGAAGTMLYFSSSGGGPDVQVRNATPTPSVSATADQERQRLQDRIAELERRQQSRSPTPDIDDQKEVMATVNSPNDGFLALRDIPDPGRGSRLAKIPHGSRVILLDCEPGETRIGGRSGRWCRARYNGINGWVFDAWLDR